MNLSLKGLHQAPQKKSEQIMFRTTPIIKKMFAALCKKRNHTQSEVLNYLLNSYLFDYTDEKLKREEEARRRKQRKEGTGELNQILQND